MHIITPASLMRILTRALAAVTVLLLFAASLNAQTYYVSSSAGSDANDGVSVATPLRTLSKVNALALTPGDTVLFRRGDIFSGELSAKPGADGRPVVYGAYGGGNRPVIDGSVRITSTGWSVSSGSIMVKDGVSMPEMDAAESPVLFFNGNVMLPARYPNSGFLTAQDVEGENPGSHCCEYSRAFTDSALGGVFQSPAVLLGALATAYDPYGVSTRQIRAYDPPTGHVAIDTLRGVAFIGYRLYFLSAARAFLDQPGEWFYDAAAKRLYAYFPGGVQPAATDTISYTSSTYGINAWQVDDIAVRDIEFRRQAIAGMFLVRSDRVAVERCAFRQAKHGVILWGSGGPPEIRVRRVRITDSEFRDLFRTGINARNLEECEISRNTFTEIGMINALGQSGNADAWGGYGYWEYGIGIQASGINTYIGLNRFRNTGRQALAVGGPGVAVRFNVVDSSCVNYNDCGAIMPLGWSRIEQNIVRHSVGPTEQFGSTGARGIYPDFRVEDTIRANTIIDTRMGIGLTNAKDEVVEGNTIYGSRDVGFRMNKKTPGILNNRVTGNIFFGLSATQRSLFWDNQVTEADVSLLDSNRYWNPYVTFPTITFKRDSASSEGWYDLASWKTTGRDAHSTQEFVSLASEYVVRDTLGGSLVSNGSFESGTAGWSYPDSITIVAGVLDGNCARMKKNSTGGKTLATVLTAELDTARRYLVRFTVADPSNIGRVNLRVRQNGGAYVVSVDRWFLTKSTRREYYTVFRPAIAGSTRLEFVSSNSVWWLDNAALFPVDALRVDPAAAFPIVVNDTEQPRVIPLGDRCYLDLDSNLVTRDITLPPFSSRILIALDSSAATSAGEPPAPSTSMLHVFPNPSTDGRIEIRVSTGSAPASLLAVYDVLGRKLVERRDLPPSTVCRLQGLPSGRYLVLLATPGSRIVKVAIVVR